MVILHALTKKFWDTYKDKSEYGEYSLNKWGFIHCSDINTFHYVAPNFKHEKDETVLLLIDTGKVKSEILWEDLRGCGVEFPHIYGLLNKSAVIAVLPYLRNDKKEWLTER